jgi:hypothetical protein
MDAQAAAMAAPPGSAAPRAGARVRAVSTDSRIASERKATKAEGAPQLSLPVDGSMKNSSSPALHGSLFKEAEGQKRGQGRGLDRGCRRGRGNVKSASRSRSGFEWSIDIRVYTTRR